MGLYIPLRRQIRARSGPDPAGLITPLCVHVYDHCSKSKVSLNEKTSLYHFITSYPLGTAQYGRGGRGEEWSSLDGWCMYVDLNTQLILALVTIRAHISLYSNALDTHCIFHTGREQTIITHLPTGRVQFPLIAFNHCNPK